MDIFPHQPSEESPHSDEGAFLAEHKEHWRALLREKIYLERTFHQLPEVLLRVPAFVEYLKGIQQNLDYYQQRLCVEENAMMAEYMEAINSTQKAAPPVYETLRHSTSVLFAQLHLLRLQLPQEYIDDSWFQLPYQLLYHAESSLAEAINLCEKHWRFLADQGFPREFLYSLQPYWKENTCPKNDATAACLANLEYELYALRHTREHATLPEDIAAKAGLSIDMCLGHMETVKSMLLRLEQVESQLLQAYQST